MTRSVADLAWFRRELEREREFRLEQLIHLSYEVSDPARADVRTKLTVGARHALAEIDAALFRISKGKFGTCELCGRPISVQVLAACPATRLCLSCER
ncbi:hypothetical protein [Kribbella hippodromi]|uniref:TraR/DksA family transcriptional regulator n=1 Tax=Kribbella hippodromi TaxID=434347 RepID=UPI0031D24415